MKNLAKKYFAILLVGLLSLLSAFGCSQVNKSNKKNDSTVTTTKANDSNTNKKDAKKEDTSQKDSKASNKQSSSKSATIDKDGSYSSKEDVAAYLRAYKKLPKNFITKKEAEALGWKGGSLEKYAPGKSIGGDHFGNYEGVLPKNTSYTECDIDTTNAKSRGAKRIVFSKDLKIYYTEDHYKTFTLLE